MKTWPPTWAWSRPKFRPLMVTRSPAQLIEGVTVDTWGGLAFSVLSLSELSFEFELSSLSLPLLLLLLLPFSLLLLLLLPFSLLLSVTRRDCATLTVISPQGVVASTYRRKRCSPANLGMMCQRQTLPSLPTYSPW